MGLFSGLFGSDDNLVAAQNRAAVAAKKTARAQAIAQRKATRAAIRAGAADRRAAARQNAALIAAERQSAAALAALGKGEEIRTEVIDDEEAKRRTVGVGTRRSAYGFSRPVGMGGLGGAPTNLG